MLYASDGIVSSTLNVNPTLSVIPRKNNWGIIDLHCCNDCHLPSEFTLKFQSSMTILDQKLVTREGRDLANG